MEIYNHRLSVPFVRSPNFGGQLLKPSLIVVHFTAGRSVKQSLETLTKPGSGKSAHLLVSKEGTVTQLVPFNKQAWHAGLSSWHGKPGCNHYSIGIELENFGFLKQSSEGWRTWFGLTVDSSSVTQAMHKFSKVSRGWETFPVKQLAGAYAACSALMETYPSITEVVGHDDVSPGRKWDPGPAFPMGKFREWLGLNPA